MSGLMKSEETEIDESELYEYAQGELENNNLNEEVWQKAMALSGHMEANARERYISMRVAQLKRNMDLEAQYAAKKEIEERRSRASVGISHISDPDIAFQKKKKGRSFYLIAAGLILFTVIAGSWFLFTSGNETDIPDANRTSQVSDVPDSFVLYPYTEEANVSSVVDKAQWKLTVQTDPPEAIVQILNIQPRYEDGMELAGGKYHMKVSKEGYISEYVWMDLDQDMNYSVKLSPELFALTVRAFPADAKVEIKNIKNIYHDGILLAGGKYRIRVSKKGYSTLEEMIDLKKNTVYKADIFTLKKNREEKRLSYYISRNPMQFSEAFPVCLDKDLRLPSVKELDKIIGANKIAVHKDAWFWTSERSGTISYNIIQNNPRRSKKDARLSEKHLVYCIQ
jgi:hypothetical protein